MRLPQQQQVDGGLVRMRPRRPDPQVSRSNEQGLDCVVPSWSAGGTADCIARCQVLPPGPDREDCINDCYF
jgi:hypothetical protein